MTRAPTLAVLVALLLAGCISGAVDDPLPSALPAGEPIDPAFGLSMTGCREAGGVSLYNMNDGDPGPVKPFRLADVQDDVGDPRIGSYGAPIPPGGATWGIWHISVVCDSYSYKGEERGALEWGWVGVKIHPPEWDDSGIERQFFIADLSFPDDDVLTALRDEHVHASATWASKVEWLAPGFLHTLLDDEEHGVFETHAKMKPYRAYEPEPIRFWMLVAAEGDHGHAMADGAGGGEGGYRAISFDLATTGGEEHMVADVTGVLSHTRTDAHGAVPGAAGNLAAVLYTGFDRTIAIGPSPERTFSETWTH